MRTKNARAIDADESAHLARVKALPCACCKTKNKPRDAHHTVQGNHFTTVPLCHEDCHQGAHGIHGDQALMKVRHLTENDMLNWTNRMLEFGTERTDRKSSTRTVPANKPGEIPRYLERRY
jgi:hypothetical protein